MRKILLSLGNSFRNWPRNLRVWSSFLFGITILLFYTTRYLSYAKAIGNNIQCFEAYLCISSQPQQFCFLILGGLLLMSDAPFLTPISQQEMIRIGRKSWIVVQILYIYLGSFLYFFVLQVIAAIYSTLTVGTYLLGGWSDAMTFLAKLQPEAVVRNFMISFPFPEMIQSISPNFAILLALILQTLYLSLVSMIILSANLIFKTNCGWIWGSSFHFVNYLILANAGYGMNVRHSLLCCIMLSYQFSPELNMSPLYCLWRIAFPSFVVLAICSANTNRIEPF